VLAVLGSVGVVRPIILAFRAEDRGSNPRPSTLLRNEVTKKEAQRAGFEPREASARESRNRFKSRRGAFCREQLVSGKCNFSTINSCYKYLEWEGYIEENPVPAFRERYMDNKRQSSTSKRQLISVEEMSSLVHSIIDPRNRALVLTLAKTGIRRGELVTIDVDDVDWEEQSITLEPKPKRSNRLVFFDGECAQSLKRWMSARANDDDVEAEALFTNQHGTRLQRNSIYRAVTKHAEKVDLHDPDSQDLQERFTPHCCRHWFTTHFRKAEMQREFIKELRGDTCGDAIDISDHIGREELR